MSEHTVCMALLHLKGIVSAEQIAVAIKKIFDGLQWPPRGNAAQNQTARQIAAGERIAEWMNRFGHSICRNDAVDAAYYIGGEGDRAWFEPLGRFERIVEEIVETVSRIEVSND